MFSLQVGLSLSEMKEKVGPIRTEEELRREKEEQEDEQQRLKRSKHTAPRPKLSDLQIQILTAEKNEAKLSDYERMRLENMRERQAMLEMLNMDEDKEDMTELALKKVSQKVDYGVREKSSRLKRIADTALTNGAGAPSVTAGRVRRSPAWVGCWWAAGGEAQVPRSELTVTGLLGRGQDWWTASKGLHRLRREVQEEQEKGRVQGVEWEAHHSLSTLATVGAEISTLDRQGALIC